MISVEVTDTGGPDAMKAVMGAAAQAAAEQTAALWHGEFMPLHWEAGAEKRYAYMPRKGDDEPPLVPITNVKRRNAFGRMGKNSDYFWWKKRKFPNAPDLVKTGQSKEMVESVMKIKSKLVKSRGEVEAVDVLNVPKYFYQYRERKEGGHVDKQDELTRTIPVEDVVLAQYMAASATAELQRRSQAVTTTENI